MARLPTTAAAAHRCRNSRLDVLPFAFIYLAWLATVVRAMVAGEWSHMYAYQLITYAIIAVHVRLGSRTAAAAGCAAAAASHRWPRLKRCCRGKRAA